MVVKKPFRLLLLLFYLWSRNQQLPIRSFSKSLKLSSSKKDENTDLTSFDYDLSKSFRHNYPSKLSAAGAHTCCC